ncbi:MAG: hypothetical protein DRJ42_23590 [Deltaproteobacteria bacterium]|nr:MAG: hypothetical protein DRJ42_23590 [Deltaproteobacteria bacterium]
MAGMDGEDGADPFGENRAGDLPALELESVRPPARQAPPSGVVEVALAPDPSSSRATLPANFDVLPPEVDNRLPTVEVAAVAEYGPAPGILGAIPYAIMVFTRRKELVATAAAAADHLKRAEGDVEQSLSDLGIALVQKADSLDGALEAISSDVASARKAADLIDESRVVDHQEAGRTEDERRAIDAELAEVRGELPPHEDLETKLNTQLEVRKVNLGRAQGQLQRAQIELRNAQSAGDTTPEKLALLEATQDRQAQEAAAAGQPVQELVGKLTDVRQNIAARLARIAQLEHDTKELAAGAERDAGQRLADEGEAHQDARKTLALLGRRALTGGVAQKADPSAARRASAADDELVRRRRRAKITSAAIDAYDKPTLYQGLGILGAAGVVVLLFVLVVLFRAIF